MGPGDLNGIGSLIRNLLIAAAIFVAAVAFAAGATCSPAFAQTTPPRARVLVFEMESCPHCVTLHKTIDKTLQNAGWTIGANKDFEYIDTGSSDARVRQYRRGRNWSCPTMVIVDKDGKELSRKSGALDAQTIADWVNNYRR